MSIAIQPKITADGLAALWNATNTGVALNLTHISIGDSAYAVSGSEKGLKSQKMRQAIGSSSRPSARHHPNAHRVFTGERILGARGGHLGRLNTVCPLVL